MTTHCRIATAIVLAMVCFGAPVRCRERIDEVLAQARRAIGADAAPIASLSVDASVRRVIKARNLDISSRVHLDFLLPDKYLRTESLTVGPISRSTTLGLNGDVILFNDGGTAAAMGLDPRTSGPQRLETIASLKLDAFRQLTFWLLSAPEGSHCTFSYAGVAEAPDGKADVVDVRGDAGRNVRLFLDTVTHRLLMATYDMASVDPVQAKVLSDRYAAQLKEQAAQGLEPDKRKVLNDRLVEDMRKLPRKTETVQVHFSDHRAFGPLTLPATMTVETGQLQEEWTISAVKLNPTLKPGLFDPR